MSIINTYDRWFPKGKAAFLPLLLITLLTFSCQPDNTTSSENFSQADSLQLQQELLDSMETEMYNTTYAEVNSDTTRIRQESICGIRNDFVIKINDRKQIMVRHEFGVPIVPSLLEYYTTNRKENDVSNNSPLYSRLKKKDIADIIARLKKEIAEAEAHNDVEQVELSTQNLEHWEKKWRSLKTLGIQSLPQVSYNSFVLIETARSLDQIDTREILDSVLLGFYLLRDQVAQEYFHESYLNLYKFYKERSFHYNLDRLEALEVLYPLHIVNEPKLKLYRHFIVHEDELPSPSMK